MRLKYLPIKILTFLFLYFQFAINLAFCQEYGLEFLGHEVITDKRTSLILGDENNFCTKSDLELAFEIKFKPNVSSYFGYVFRIIDQDNKNIDLLFQSDSKGKQQKFRIISGDKDIKLEKQLDSVTLYSKWNLFKVQIEDNQLKIFCNNQLYGKGAIPFSFKKCFKIYFGECSHPKFLTSDVLPMYLRNVTIKSANELLHHWPLREIYGNNSMDNVAQSKAISKNAQWLLKNHFEWKLLKKLKFKGNSSFAFNDKSRVIQINSDLKTYFFSTKNDSLSYKNFTSSHKKFTFGDCAIFLNNKLVNVRLNERQIFDYDFNKNNWNISANTKYNLTEYWHHNKYAYPNDTALVLIGGYGQYKYKNRVQKFSFNTNSWSDLSMTGDIIEPRYMFGLGSKENMKSYLFGGFGSKTGDQGMNPQNYYDLFEIDWQKNRVRKVYDLKNPDSTFVVASSLIVNQSKDSFYGLIYNQLKFKSSLQLVEGSLSKPELNRISKEIPYKFIDVSSFADLYFDKINSKLYCVTSFFDRLPADSTEIEIYSLDFPPSNLPVVAKNNPSFFQSTVKFGLFAVLILTVLFGVIWYLINNNYQSNLVNEENVALNEESEIPQEMHDNIINVGNENKGKISLFGGFQFINNNGVDLTNQFSPLLKEMFLYLLLNSIKWNKGVNSSQLNDMFWNDKTTSSARNNRSVNITKLKTIFEQLPAIQITKDTGNWKIVFEPSKVSIDYFEFQKLTNAKKTLNVEQINDLTSIVNQGAFLSNLEYEWLDDFKAEISNKVIDAYLAYSEQLPISQYAEEIIEIADNIFKFDSVDETAMSLKCKSLVYLGKHSLAKSSYEKFAKDYQRLYSEEYEVSYKEILES